MTGWVNKNNDHKKKTEYENIIMMTSSTNYDIANESEICDIKSNIIYYS